MKLKNRCQLCGGTVVDFKCQYCRAEYENTKNKLVPKTISTIYKNDDDIMNDPYIVLKICDKNIKFYISSREMECLSCYEMPRIRLELISMGEIENEDNN